MKDSNVLIETVLSGTPAADVVNEAVGKPVFKYRLYAAGWQFILEGQIVKAIDGLEARISFQPISNRNEVLPSFLLHSSKAESADEAMGVLKNLEDGIKLAKGA